jgi:hypothetical protein
VLLLVLIMSQESLKSCKDVAGFGWERFAIETVRGAPPAPVPARRPANAPDSGIPRVPSGVYLGRSHSK